MAAAAFEQLNGLSMSHGQRRSSDRLLFARERSEVQTPNFTQIQSRRRDSDGPQQLERYAPPRTWKSWLGIRFGQLRAKVSTELAKTSRSVSVAARGPNRLKPTVCFGKFVESSYSEHNLAIIRFI